jgi:hypothetical protein
MVSMRNFTRFDISVGWQGVRLRAVSYGLPDIGARLQKLRLLRAIADSSAAVTLVPIDRVPWTHCEGIHMELLLSPPLATRLSIDAKPNAVEAVWISVTDRLPDDGQPVQVLMQHSRAILTAWRGHYQSTGAWFDAETHQPIYETIAHWRSIS